MSRVSNACARRGASQACAQARGRFAAELSAIGGVGHADSQVGGPRACGTMTACPCCHRPDRFMAPSLFLSIGLRMAQSEATGGWGTLKCGLASVSDLCVWLIPHAADRPLGSPTRRCCSSRRRLTPPSHRFKPAITNYRMYARPRPASPDDAPALSHAAGRVLRQTGDAAATFTFPRTTKEDEFPCIFHSRRGPLSPADSRARI